MTSQQEILDAMEKGKPMKWSDIVSALGYAYKQAQGKINRQLVALVKWKSIERNDDGTYTKVVD